MYVNPEGSPKNKVWLIGEAPGAAEDKQGQPFVGGAGLTLNGMLSEVGIERASCYVDNVIRERPEANNFGLFYTDKSRNKPKSELLEAHSRLQQLVREHKPNLVVAFGNESLYALTGHKQIMKWRGSVLGCGGVKVIPMIHPSMVMRMPENRPICIMDFAKVIRESLGPEFPNPYTDNLTINPTFERAMYFLTDFLPKQKYLSFDIETEQNQIECVGFGWSKQDSVCIPIFYAGNNWWTTAQETHLVNAIRQLFKRDNINFIAQNAQFDMTVMKDLWKVEVVNLWMDTMIAFHCVYPELRKGLAFIASIYTQRPYYKDDSSGSSEKRWNYNCLDTVATWESAMEIRKELKEFGTFEFYNTHSHLAVKPLMEMQRFGVNINQKMRAGIDANLDKEIIRMRARLDESVGHPLNPNSTKQMKEFLYVELKLPVQKNRKTKAITTDEEAIDFLASKFPNPVFELIIDIRKARKLLSTYIRAPLDADGRIRCSYDITGTVTGRLSSRKSIYGSGTNLQNIPRGELVRSIFIPDEGHTLINADLSQAEARVVAYLADETRQQAIFERPDGDIHRAVASQLYNIPIRQITEEQRQFAKPVAHAANYGVGSRTLAKTLSCPEAKARTLLNQYYASYPCIKLWHRRVEEGLRKSRTMRTPFGRARTFFGRWGKDLHREAIAHVPQSTVGDLLNKGIIRAWYCTPPGWRILMQVHDNIIMQVPDEAHPMHVHKFIKHYFEIPFKIGRYMVKIPMDIKAGKSWGVMHKLDIDGSTL